MSNQRGSVTRGTSVQGLQVDEEMLTADLQRYRLTAAQRDRLLGAFQLGTDVVKRVEQEVAPSMLRLTFRRVFLWKALVVPPSAVNFGPPMAAKFLLLLIPKKHREGLIGDLEEEFNTVLLPEYGPGWAKFYYWWHVILACTSAAQNVVFALTKFLLRSG